MTGAGISRLSLTGSSRAAKEGGIDKAQAAQIGSFETASLHVGFAQAGFDEARLPEVAFPKIGLRQVDAVHRRPVKREARQLGVDQQRFIETEVDGAHVGQVSAGKFALFEPRGFQRSNDQSDRSR